MNRTTINNVAFSLVELTLALGVAAFCLITLFGLLPIGVLANRNATSQTAATNIIASVIADMRATTSSTSPQYGITLGTGKTLYFDSTGQFTTGLAANSRYKLNVTFSQQNPAPTLPALPTIYADLKVTWPAAATPANASGSAEMFAAFDRN